jgi:hypothetical protein
VLGRASGESSIGPGPGSVPGDGVGGSVVDRAYGSGSSGGGCGLGGGVCGLGGSGWCSSWR